MRYFVRIRYLWVSFHSQEKSIRNVSINIIEPLIFVMEMQCVFWEVKAIFEVMFRSSFYIAQLSLLIVTNILSVFLRSILLLYNDTFLTLVNELSNLYSP